MLVKVLLFFLQLAWGQVIPPYNPVMESNFGNMEGKLAKDKELPWLVSVQKSRTLAHIGGGALLTRFFVFTTCQLLSGGVAALNRAPIAVTHDVFFLTVGSIHLSYARPGPPQEWTGQRRNSSIVHYHPGCRRKDGVQAWELDYALIEIKVPFKVNEFVQPIPFASDEKILLNEMGAGQTVCSTAGWGKARIGLRVPVWMWMSIAGMVWKRERLPSCEQMSVTVKVYDFKACNSKIAKRYKLTMNATSCVCGLPIHSGQKDGDVGSLLMCGGEMHGVLSSTPLGLDSASIYSSTLLSLPWIRSVVPDYMSPPPAPSTTEISMSNATTELTSLAPSNASLLLPDFPPKTLLIIVAVGVTSDIFLTKEPYQFDAYFRRYQRFYDWKIFNYNLK